jgi:hypothetical protein
MLNTYFFIQIKLDKNRSIEFGPYIKFEEAAEILLEHCNFLLECYFTDLPDKYCASIVERWNSAANLETICIKVQEEKVYRDAKDDKPA